MQNWKWKGAGHTEEQNKVLRLGDIESGGQWGQAAQLDGAI